MAKRKGKARPRRKKKQPGSSFLVSVRRLFLSAFVVFVCFIGLLFLYPYFHPAVERKTPPAEQTKKQKASSAVSAERDGEKKIPAGKKEKRSSATVSWTKNAEIPRLLTRRSEQVIRHEGYTVSYNSDYRIANWVAYELTAGEAKSKKNERSNKFVPDPQVKGASATNEDYTRTGYDRGHLAPAGDMKWSAKAMRESFYLSNICPQKPGLNRGIWKELEEQCRLWALDNGALLVVTGPVIPDHPLRRLGKNRVGIPERFYKVIGAISDGKYRAVGFLFENRDYGHTSLRSTAIPVDSVEKVTGIDFFPALPDAIEKEMEASVDWAAWSF